MEFSTRACKSGNMEGDIYSPMFSKRNFSIKKLENTIEKYFYEFQDTVFDEPRLKETYNMSNIKGPSGENKSYFFLEDRIKRQEIFAEQLKRKYEGKFIGTADLTILGSIINNEIRKYNLRLNNYNRKGEKKPFIEREKMPARIGDSTESGKDFMKRHRMYADDLAEFAAEKASYLAKARDAAEQIREELIAEARVEFSIDTAYRSSEEKYELDRKFEKFARQLLPATTYHLNKLSQDDDLESDEQKIARQELVNEALDSDFARDLESRCIGYNSADMNILCSDAVKKYQEQLLKALPKRQMGGACEKGYADYSIAPAPLTA